MNDWARERFEALGRALAKAATPVRPSPPPPSAAPPRLTAREDLRREDLGGQLEDLRVFVGECEADWRLNDRLDLAARLRRDG